MIAELFQMAATSIAHAAREVAERGRPDPESAEFRRFAGLLVKFMDSEPDIVPIETLGTIVRRGTAATPTRPATLGRLELVSHGEHLRQAADSLERAPSATQRELRAHTLAGTFRVLGAAGGGPVAERVAEFAQAAREAVSSGIAVNQAAHFAAELRKAGEVLSASGSGDETSTAAALAAVTIAIRRLGGGAAVPIESLAPTHSQPAAPAPAAPPPPSTPADRARRSGAVREPVGGGRGGAGRGSCLLGLAVSVALLAWVLHRIDLRQVWDDARHASPLLLLAAVVLATATFPLRTIRWRLILRDIDGHRFPSLPLWHATAIGFMANNLLPARAGEVARAYVATRQLPVRFTTSLASIGVERVFARLIMLALMAGPTPPP